eukprot:739819-Pleurochrysis_carterae.AAC.1
MDTKSASAPKENRKRRYCRSLLESPPRKASLCRGLSTARRQHAAAALVCHGKAPCIMASLRQERTKGSTSQSYVKV